MNVTLNLVAEFEDIPNEVAHMLMFVKDELAFAGRRTANVSAKLSEKEVDRTKKKLEGYVKGRQGVISEKYKDVYKEAVMSDFEPYFTGDISRSERPSTDTLLEPNQKVMAHPKTGKRYIVDKETNTIIGEYK